MGANSKEDLLKQFIQSKEQGFKVDDKEEMLLPRPSIFSAHGFSKHLDVFKKKIIKLGENSQINFITKNGLSQSPVWQTTTEKIKEGVRWGIIKTESLTGNVIGALGRYRVIAHERIARGLISNTHLSKIALVEFYQRQFEAMQELESLVNRPNTVEDFEQAITAYKIKLDEIKKDIPEIFKDTLILNEMKQSINKFERNIEAAKKRADNYMKKLHLSQSTPESCSLATGNNSIQQFVKRQLSRSLHQLSGMNKDLTYTDSRDTIAFSSGELNDCIEDALDITNSFEPDVVNRIEPEHHGIFGASGEIISYDFHADHLTPDKERQALLAISFIEKKDKVIFSKDQKTGKIKAAIETIDNDSTALTADLKSITKTGWSKSRSWRDSWSRKADSIANFFKGVLFYTRPWDGNPWGNGFELFAFKLRKHSTQYKPLWKKPFHYLNMLKNDVVDIAHVIKDFSLSIFRLPTIFINDWKSTKKLDWKEEKHQLDKAIKRIELQEEATLDGMLNSINSSILIKNGKENRSHCFSRQELIAETDKHFPRLAGYQFHRSVLEQNDFLTQIIHNANETAHSIAQNIFAKQPVAAILYTALTVTAATYYFAPHLFQAVDPELSKAIANVFNKAADNMAKGPLPSNPYNLNPSCTRLGTRFFNTYLNIAPRYSDLELGKTPSDDNKLFDLSASQELNTLFDKFHLATWLAKHQATLPKLSFNKKLIIETKIKEVFSHTEAQSLCKILYPEKLRSPVYQFFFIPLSYIPAILHVLVSPFISLAAAIARRDNPAAPMINAGQALLQKSARDLVRLLVFGKEVAYLIYNITSTLLKWPLALVGMTVGLIAGAYGKSIAQTYFGGLAEISIFFGKVGGFIKHWLGIDGAIKSVQSPHQNDTFGRIRGSYESLLPSMKVDSKNQEENSLTESTDSEESAEESEENCNTLIRPVGHLLPSQKTLREKAQTVAVENDTNHSLRQ